MNLPVRPRGDSSATLTPTLLLILFCTGLGAIASLAAQPAWWNSRNAVHPPVVVTNNGVVTTNYAPNDYAVVNQGQLKQFTARAVDELNARLPNGGAGPALSNLVYGWQQDYLTNNYASNPANPARPYKPSDLQAVNVGQLKYVGKLVWSQLTNAGYTATLPTWLGQTNAADQNAANLGQLKTVFNFDVSQPPAAVFNLTATAAPNEIDLTWTNPPNNPATSLTVTQTDAQGNATVFTLSAGSTSFNATGLMAGQTYTFQVSSSNGMGQASTPAAPATTPPPAPPAQPNRYAVIDLGTTHLYGSLADNGMVLFDGYSPARWVLGTWQNLTVPGAQSYYAYSMNNNGAVVGGASFVPATSLDSNTRGIIWTTDPSKPIIQSSDTPFSYDNQYGHHNVSARSYDFCLDANPPADYGYGAVFGSQIIGGVYSMNGQFFNGSNGTLPGVFAFASDASVLFFPNGSSQRIDDYNFATGAGTYKSFLTVNANYLISDDLYSLSSGEVVRCYKNPASSSTAGVDIPLYGNDPIAINVGITNAKNPQDDLLAIATTDNFYLWNISSQQTTASFLNCDFSGINTRTYTPPATTANPNPTPVPNYQVIGTLGHYGQPGTISELWERRLDATGAPANPPSYHATPAANLLPNSSPWTVTALTGINTPGAIVGTATYSGSDPTIAAGSHGIMLLPGELCVDANRDGTIVMANDAGNPANVDPTTGNPLPVDTTSQTAPFRFWVNDGQNTGEDQAPLTGSQVTTANDTLGSINFKGDLENFARLWIYTKGLNQAIHDGTIKLGLKWENTTGTPSINVYKAYESDGGTQYLKNDTTAGNQIAGSYGTAIAQVTGTSTVVLPTSLFGNLSESSPKTYLLFEGTHAGVGKLTLVYVKSDGVTKIGEGGQVYMSLKTVTDMFEQAQVTPPGQTDIANPYSFPANGNWSSSTATNDANGPPSYAPGTTPSVAWNDTTSSNFEHPTDETKQFLLFVHGWNVTNGRYTEQSGECFKRLWWQGYKGIYAAIRWPGDLTGADQSSWWTTAANALDYFEIEYRAFKYGQSVKQYTDHFNAAGYTVGVVGHSMGNIVSSEALKSGGNFTYVLMDGAVSARCYDTSSSLLLTGVTFNPPDLSSSGGYGSYFSGLSGGPTSFYNSQDPALQAWATGNVLLKGETDANNLSYVFTGGVGVQLKYVLSPAHPDPLYRDVFANGVTNTHESMTMYAVTRTAAVGIESVGGSVSSLDMQTDFPGAASHSPQFDYNIQHGPMTFYKKVLSGLDFPVNP